MEWGIKALRAGKHVYMQKPLSGDMAEADAFVAEVEKHPRLTVLCLPHFGDVVQTIRKHVRDGVIGKVAGGRARSAHGGPEVYYREVARFFGEPPPEGELWFFDAKRAGVGALFDMGVYAVAHTVALLGSVKSVQGRHRDDRQADRTGRHGQPRHADGERRGGDGRDVLVRPGAHVGVLRPRHRRQVPRGGRGAPDPPRSDRAWIATTRRSTVSEVRPTVKVGSSHAHWLDCIEKGMQPPVSHAYAARHVTEVLLAGLESGRTGRAVAIRSRARGRCEGSASTAISC